MSEVNDTIIFTTEEGGSSLCKQYNISHSPARASNFKINLVALDSVLCLGTGVKGWCYGYGVLTVSGKLW